MFTKILTGFTASMVVSSMVMAGTLAVRPAERATELRPEEKVRTEKGSELLKGGKAAETELNRAGKKTEAEGTITRAGVQSRSEVAPQSNLSRVQSSSSLSNAQLKDMIKAKAATNKNSEKTFPAVEAKVSKVMDHVAAELEKGMGKDKSAEVMGELATVPASKKLAVAEFSAVMAQRLHHGMGADLVGGLLKAVAKSPRILNGELVVGDGAAGNCRSMQQLAVDNFAKATIEGIERGTDSLTVTKEIGFSLARQLGLAEGEGLSRVCSITNGCSMWGKPIKAACGQMHVAALQ